MAEQDPGLPTQAIWDIPFESLEFKERIGKGSFGSVFKGVYLGLDVAIKKIEKADDPEYIKYIDREVSMLQSLRHPFIVQFSGICVHSTGLYIITEYVSGGDVRQLLKQTPPIGWDKRLSIATDLAKAMVFLHAKKIIHRDLKSKNILLDEHQRIRLCDFGFARMNEPNVSKRTRLTMCGTEGWVAPEILLGMSYDTSCDVFSFGVVLSELITGRKPGVDLWIRTPETCFDINQDELRKKALPGCPSKLIDICNECCTYEPTARPKFDDVLKILQSIPVPPPISNEIKSPDASNIQLNQSQNNTNQNNNTKQSTTPPAHTPTIAQSRRNVVFDENNNNTAPTNTTTTNNRKTTTMDSVIGSNWRVGELKPAGYYTLKRRMATNQTALTNHLVKMVERATSDYCYDTSYIQDLLLTYRCFSTPQNLYDLLANRYVLMAPDQVANGDMALWKRVNRVIQLRCIIFFKRWIDYYPGDFQEDGMMEKLNDIDHIIVQNNLAALSLTSTLQPAPEGMESVSLAAELTKKRHDMSANPILPSNAKFPISIIPSPPANGQEYLDVFDIHAHELARQFTLINGANFLQIQPREYLEFCWEKLTDSSVGSRDTGGISPWVGTSSLPPTRPAASIHTFLEHYDDLVRFVATEVVKQRAMDRRVGTVERFIDAADRCYQHYDFASVFCILDGLAVPSVERLSETFKQLPPRTVALLDQLKQFTSTANDFKRYRERLQDAQAPTIPHVRLLLDELLFIETSSPKLLNGGIVNFFHYRQLSRKILHAQQLVASGLPHFRPVPSIQKILSKPHSELYDDTVLKHFSLTAEPPVSL